MGKKVSICIPVYNGEKTIERAIRSAMAQTYDNIEILVIDNRSEDRTKEIVDGMEDSRIVFLQNETNLGMAGNWNQCIKKAAGEYIHFLCADDTIKPECIKKKAEVMEKFPDVVMVTSATDLVDENDEFIMKRKRYDKNVIIDGRAYSRRSFREGNVFGEPSNILFKKECTEKTGLFSTDLHYTTDWDLWIKIASMGKVAYLKDSLTEYRLSSNNATSTMKLKKIMEDEEKLIRRIREQDYYDMSPAAGLFMKSMLAAKDVCRLAFMRSFPMIINIRKRFSL